MITTDIGALSNGRANSTSATKGTLDEQLMVRIAGGNRLAMRVLYARFNERVYRFALRLTGDVGLAEDVVSEVFFEVWRKAATFEGRSQVSTWILGITRNKALDARKARWTDGWDEEAAEAVEDPASNPEVEYQKKDLGALMRKCLAQLSPAHREIIDLVYYHGKSIEEVASLTSAGPATVKTRMFYARKHLAELLGAYGITTAAA
jgi:RNA polymerase sigma-70 factor (ECF subfamily)